MLFAFAATAASMISWVSFALQGDDSGEAVTYLCKHTAVRCLAVCTLCGDSLTFLAQDILCLVHITLSLCESLLYISEAGTCHGAQLLDVFH